MKSRKQKIDSNIHTLYIRGTPLQQFVALEMELKNKTVSARIKVDIFKQIWSVGACSSPDNGYKIYIQK